MLGHQKYWWKMIDTLKGEKQEDYALYAKYCLDLVETAPNYKIRILLRQMAAEWTVLAEQAENEHTVVAASANRRTNGHTEPDR